MTTRGRKKGAKKTPGSGRKKGSRNRATVIAGAKRAEIIEQAAKDGVTPLEVMLGNMKFAHEQAAGVLAKIMGTPDGASIDVLAELLKIRQMAQECAKDAAPYVHPKLSSIDFKGDLDVGFKKHEEALDALAEMADLGTSASTAH